MRNNCAIAESIRSYGSSLAEARRVVRCSERRRIYGYSRRGGWTLITRAMESLGLALPYNWHSWPRHAGMGVELPYQGGKPRGVLPRGHLAEVAQVAGWIRSAAGHPLVVKLIRKNLDYGVGCPGCTVNPFILARRWSSPGRLARWLRHLVRRADQILGGYGLRASWSALAAAAQGSGDMRPRKVAYRVAAATVSVAWPYQDYRGLSPREILIASRGLAAARSRSDWSTLSRHLLHRGEDATPAAVASLRAKLDEHGADPASETRVWGCRVREIVGGGWVVMLGERVRYLEHAGDARDATRRALEYWTEPRRLAEITTTGRYRGEVVLVTVDDALRSGFCREGITEWLINAGLVAPVPATQLVGHPDKRVTQVLVTAARRTLGLRRQY